MGATEFILIAAILTIVASVIFISRMSNREYVNKEPEENKEENQFEKQNTSDIILIIVALMLEGDYSDKEIMGEIRKILALMEEASELDINFYLATRLVSLGSERDFKERKKEDQDE